MKGIGGAFITLAIVESSSGAASAPARKTVIVSTPGRHHEDDPVDRANLVQPCRDPPRRATGARRKRGLAHAAHRNELDLRKERLMPSNRGTTGPEARPGSSSVLIRHS
jgi:hypothetical protein